jgi:3-methylfumaryl-CoA hydratase
MSGVAADKLAQWKTAVGRVENRYERLERESLRRYALAVGSNADVERVLPPLAHWAFFLPRAVDIDIGEDGHCRRGGFLPPITLPRRMFAAAEIDFEAPLLLGEEAQLTSTIAGVTHKSGKTGDLVFVEVDKLLSQQGSLRVRERQSYVYKDAGAPIQLPPVGEQLIEGQRWQPGAVNLFRFSAATFNSHRIHYDLSYARNEEGYPALVVHGPLTAARLAGLAESAGPLASFSFRAQAPLFLGPPVYLQRDGGEVRAVRCDGTTAMTARVRYR